MTPDEVRRASFPTVRRGGYETREVDVFLAEAVAALDADDGRMRPDDIRDARFTLVKRGGYDTQEVDVFLDELMGEFDRRSRSGSAVTADAPAPEQGGVADAPAPPKETAVAGPTDGSGTEPSPPPAPEDERARPSGPSITSDQLRGLTPPGAATDGYDTTEVQGFLDAVADTLEAFEAVSGESLIQLLGAQYLQGADGGPLLLTSDQILAARFTVRPDGGYDVRGVNAAVRRLGRALDYHWQRGD